MSINCQHLTITDPVLILVGPTAVGKTALSIELAKRYGCEIVNVDSMQVYRLMDIGTAKISETEKQGVRHHLIDIVDPDEHYHAGRFVKDCLAVMAQIQKRGSIPLLTGGTGLYFQALKNGLFDDGGVDPGLRKRLADRLETEGSLNLHRELALVDPTAAGKIHPHDRARIIRALEIYHHSGQAISEHLSRQPRPTRFEKLLSIGLDRERKELYRRIDQRTEQMLDQGLESEVRFLLNQGYSPELKSMQAIGYRHLVQYLAGDWSYPEMVRLLARDTRRYAKRQLTWFKRDEDIEWFAVTDCRRIFERIDAWLEDSGSHFNGVH